jgi:predicted Kef-type K+ transport protein
VRAAKKPAKLSWLVGYLVAGVAFGLAAPGFVAGIEFFAQQPEISVMLPMVGVGLQVSRQKKAPRSDRFGQRT